MRSKNKGLLAAILCIVLAISFASCSKETTVSTDKMFTERDYDTSYDESEATKINLSKQSDTVTIDEEGTYILSGSLNGQVLVNVDDADKVQLVLDNVTITNSSSAAIYVKQADKVFVTMAEGSNNTLTTTGSYVAIDESNIDGVVFAKCDITFNGEGTLTVSGAAGHGIVSKDDLKFTSGTYNVTGAEHALQGKDSVRIGGGTLNLTAGEDGVHSENEEQADSGKGFVYMCDGTVNIAAGDDGMHGGIYTKIAGGTINVTSSYEGIEAQKIYIDDGTINITASDDGMNAASGETTNSNDPMAADEDCTLEINGGKLYINAEGDGVDSNGTLVITGGETCVDGPVNGGNGPIDYGSSASISGGTLIAVGSSDMYESFEEADGQGIFAINASGNAGDTITITDSDGNEVYSYTPSKSYQCITFSSDKIKKGSTYTVKYGSNSTTVEMSDLIVSYVNSTMGGGMGGGMQQPGSQGGGSGGGQGGGTDPGAGGGGGSGGGGPSRP